MKNKKGFAIFCWILSVGYISFAIWGEENLLKSWLVMGIIWLLMGVVYWIKGNKENKKEKHFEE